MCPLTCFLFGDAEADFRGDFDLGELIVALANGLSDRATNQRLTFHHAHPQNTLLPRVVCVQLASRSQASASISCGGHRETSPQQRPVQKKSENKQMAEMVVDKLECGKLGHIHNP